ncbi:MAG: GNAT family N-acetyltransferase [Clostridium sp.]
MEFKLLNRDDYLLNIGGIQKLFSSSFKREISSEYLNWRYLENPLNEVRAFVAIDNNEIISNYSISPIILNIKGKSEKFGLSMTTMTHPAYRGRGLFKFLAEGLYKELIKDGYGGVIGFPNKNSHGVFINKLGWSDIYEIPTMKLNLNNYNIKQVTNNIRSLSFKENLSQKTDEISIYKDKDYLKWRFEKNPINHYEIYGEVKNEEVKGKIIFKRFNDEIDIVYMEYEDLNSLNSMLCGVLDIFKWKGIKGVNLWTNLFKEGHEVIEKIGFEENLPVTYFGGRIFKEDLKDIFHYRNWNIQMGDSDVY